MSGYRECDHKALVAGVMTVFAMVEFPADDPPASITIGGMIYERRGMDAKRRELARRLYAEGVTISDIAKNLGVPRAVVQRHASAHRDEFPRRKAPPLTTLQVRRIHELRAAGRSVKSIAYEVGCSASTVKKWLRNE